MTLVSDGTNTYLYVNGVLDNTGTQTRGSATHVGRIGTYCDPTCTDFWNGQLDDVRIYNRALTAGDIDQLYHFGHGALTKPPNNLGLVGYWSFDDGTGTQATDFSGNGNTITTNASWVSGEHNKALSFDGSSQAAQTASPINFNSSIITVSFWLNWNAFADDDREAMELTSYFNSNDNAFLIDPNSGTFPGTFEVGVQSGGSA